MVRTNFTLPDDMKFGEGNIIAITAYTVMLALGLATNSISLQNLLHRRFVKKDRNRMTVLLIHLAVADLLVIWFHTL